MDKRIKEAIEITGDWAKVLTCLYEAGLYVTYWAEFDHKILDCFDYFGEEDERFVAVGKSEDVVVSLSFHGEMAIWIPDDTELLRQERNRQACIKFLRGEITRDELLSLLSLYYRG